MNSEPFQSLFVYLFIEGPLSVITILVLELLDSKGMSSVWSPDALQCGEPWSQLDTSLRLVMPLSCEVKLRRPCAGLTMTLFLKYFRSQRSLGRQQMILEKSPTFV